MVMGIMKTALTVIIYDRDANLRAWCKAWELSRSRFPSVEFRVICTNPLKTNAYRNYVESVGGIFIARENSGYDIGTLQDIARRRLKGFDDYDFLLWCVDDLVPIRPDFLDVFFAARTGPSEIPVFEMSLNPVRHVRTTGLFMPREFVEQLEFPVDPIQTKEHCYKFEHRENGNHFLLQIEKRGYHAKQISPVVSSPMWDTGRSGNYLTPRQKDFRAGWLDVYEKKYGSSGGRVEIFATAFETYPMVAHSLMAQTHKDWHLTVEHDGEPPKDYEKLLPQDKRIKFTFSKNREQLYGHTKRQRFIDALDKSEAVFVLITNHDNYYAPNFLSEAIAALEEDANALAAYCDFGHHYIKHDILPARPHRGFIDCGSVLFRRSEIVGVAWQSLDHSADWFWFDAIAKNRGGFRRWKKFQGVHFVHN